MLLGGGEEERRNLLIKFEAAACGLMNEQSTRSLFDLASADRGEKADTAAAVIGANLKQSPTPPRETIMFAMTAMSLSVTRWTESQTTLC